MNNRYLSHLLLQESMVLTTDLEASSTDPGLLKKHSTLKSYTAGGIIYPSIRTFFHPHPQAAKLPSKPTPLPLLVFVHGLGGSAAQFAVSVPCPVCFWILIVIGDSLYSQV